MLVFTVAGVLAVYGRTVQFDFTNWDDGAYVTENRDLDPLSWEEVVDQAGRFVNGNWHPITMLSFSTDLWLAGEDPGWSHGVNVGLHLLNCLLVFAFLRALTRAPLLSAGAALLFAVHPAHVESVAWVSARKDLLFVLFGLLMLICYLRHARSQDRTMYGLSLVLFSLSCMSKAMAVSLAPTLVLIDHFLGRSLRTRGIWIEKLPFFAIAIVIGTVAVKAQQAAHGMTEVPHALPGRSVLALANIPIYLFQQAVPIDIWAFHPYPEAGRIPIQYWIALCAGIGLFAYLIRTRCRDLIPAGLAFFIINIALVLQLVPVGAALRAERYTYLGGVGSALALAGLISALSMWLRRSQGPVFLGLIMAYGAVLVIVASERCATWRDSITLWNDVLEHDHTMVAPYLNRGAAFYARRDLDRAKADYDVAIRIEPEHTEARANRGLIFLERGAYQEAAEDLEVAARRSEQATVMANASFVLIRLGRFEEARAYCDRALELDPDMPIAHGNRALCRIQLHDPQGALEDAMRFRKLDPSNPLSEQVMWHAWLAHGDTATVCEAMRNSLTQDAGSIAERTRLMALACNEVR